MTDFDSLIRDAEQLPLQGWDFSLLAERRERHKPPWNLRRVVKDQRICSCG
jgi:hypothetical protein